MESGSKLSYTKSEKFESSPEQMSLLTLTNMPDILVTGQSGTSGSLEQVIEQRELNKHPIDSQNYRVGEV